MLRDLLSPLSLVYGGAAALHRKAYSTGWLTQRRVRVPVISVGGLTVGGSGKTPVCGFLARRLMERGLRVGVVCGAVGGRSRRQITRLTPESRFDPRAAQDHGDEALMLAGWLPGGEVICGADKAAAAALAAEGGAQVVLLDDGFQHHRLEKDLEIVIWDEREDLRPLPAGRAREPRSALSRADLRWCHSRDGSVLPAHPDWICSRLKAMDLLDMAGARLGPASDLRGLRVHLVAGIAQPAAFETLVRRLGAQVVGTTFVRDHKKLTLTQVDSAKWVAPRRAPAPRGAPRTQVDSAKWVAPRGEDLLLCTEKDAARMAGQGAGLTVLACAVELTHGEQLLERSLLGVLGC